MARSALSAAVLAVLMAGAAVILSPAPVAAAPTVMYDVTGTIPLPGSGRGVDVDPARGLVYVTTDLAGVVVVDEATRAVVATIPVSDAYDVAVEPTSGFVFVTQFGSNSVAVIDPSTRVVVATVPVGDSPTGITVAASGAVVYVANWTGNSVSVLDISTPSSPMVSATFIGVDSPEHVDEGPGAATLYVSAPNSNTVYVLDGASGATVATWTDVGWVHQVALSADSTQAFLTNEFDVAQVFDTATNTMIGTIPVLGSWYQSVDRGRQTLFMAGNGIVSVLDDATGAVSQTIPVAGAMTIATDPVRGLTFVPSGAELTVISAPLVVTQQPADQTAVSGGTATFTAAATGDPTPTVQWELSTEGVTWAPVAGATDPTLVVSGVTPADSGAQFRAMFVNATGTAVTQAATLTVTVPELTPDDPTPDEPSPPAPETEVAGEVVEAEEPVDVEEMFEGEEIAVAGETVDADSLPETGRSVTGPIGIASLLVALGALLVAASGGVRSGARTPRSR